MEVTMKLETESGATIENSSDEQIDSTLRELVSSGGGFAILSQSEQVCIQTAENGDGECTLEYREGSEESHFCCTNEELSIDDVIGAFQKYANNNDAWKKRFLWRPLYMDADAEDQTASSESLSEEAQFDTAAAGKSGCLGMALFIAVVVLLRMSIK
jgi:hypothetical protein